MSNKYAGSGTKRSHHVWRRYLESFHNKAGQVFCYDLSSGKYFSNATSNLGTENDIYRIKNRISEEDVKVFRKLFKIEQFTCESEENLLYDLIDYINSDLKNRLAMPGNQQEPMISEVIAQLKSKYGTPFFERKQEELFSLYENDYLPIFHDLLSGNTSWYDSLIVDREKAIEACSMARYYKLSKFYTLDTFDFMEYLYLQCGLANQIPRLHAAKGITNQFFEDQLREIDVLFPSTDYRKYFKLYDFVSFICTQCFRTSKHYNFLTEKARDINGMNPQSISFLFLHFQSHKIGCQLIKEGFNIYLLRNNTDIPFITTDQPIINLIPRSILEEVGTIDFYYPLSPTLAMLYSGLLPISDCVDEEKVRHLNQMLANEAKQYVYSSSDDFVKAGIKQRIH